MRRHVAIAFVFVAAGAAILAGQQPPAQGRGGGRGAQDTLVVPATQGAPLADAWMQTHCGDPTSASYHVVPTAGHDLSPTDVEATLDPWMDAHTRLPDANVVGEHPSARCRPSDQTRRGVVIRTGRPTK